MKFYSSPSRRKTTGEPLETKIKQSLPIHRILLGTSKDRPGITLSNSMTNFSVTSNGTYPRTPYRNPSTGPIINTGQMGTKSIRRENNLSIRSRFPAPVFSTRRKNTYFTRGRTEFNSLKSSSTGCFSPAGFIQTITRAPASIRGPCRRLKVEKKKKRKEI